MNGRPALLALSSIRFTAQLRYCFLSLGEQQSQLTPATDEAHATVYPHLCQRSIANLNSGGDCMPIAYLDKRSNRLD
jgi:hypothetical protein